VTLPRPSRSWIGLLLLIALVVLVVAACAPVGSPAATGSPGASPTVTPTPAAAIPLTPAKPGADPIALLAWLFTPIFWLLFNALVVFDKVTGNIAIAIVLLTLVIRALLIVPFRRQIVSQRRMQLIQPEMRELQKRYKGDRAKLMSAQQQFYRERGVSPTSGCLPLVLQFVLLIPMYSVISQGLQNFNPQAMTPIDLGCSATPQIDPITGHVIPCLDAVAFGINWGVPEVFIGTTGAIFSGLSLLALISAGLQFIASRMTLPPADPTNTDQNVKIQRQMVVFLPLISLVYGSILPAGLFIYWIVTTIFSIVQQYLIIGWGSMFPILGWYPSFARDHTPRFPVSTPPVTPAPDGKPSITQSVDRAASAASTIKSRQRGRQGRRGRRR
jgi:YidC/Oxa1 family membrane protein insertase